MTNSWHAQLAVNLALGGSVTIIVAQHMYAMPPYPYIAIDYPTQLSLFTHHMWIGGFLVVGAGAHASIAMVRDYIPAQNIDNVLDRVLKARDAIISHLNWVCIWLGAHSFGLYIHNDTMRALGRPQDMFSDSAISIQPIFAQWIQGLHAAARLHRSQCPLGCERGVWWSGCGCCRQGCCCSDDPGYGGLHGPPHPCLHDPRHRADPAEGVLYAATHV